MASCPGAFDKSILKDLNFIVTQLDELSPDQRNVFIDHWHQAYVDNAGISTDDEDLRICRDNLKTALRLQPQIGRLATNPLLCAGICALHEINCTTLPKNE